MLGAHQAAMLGMARGVNAVNTSVLCHFESSTFTDETGNYTISRRAGTEGVASDYAFSGNSYKKISSETTLGLSVVGITNDLLRSGLAWTIDCWARLGSTTTTGAILSCTTGGAYSGFLLWNNAENTVRFLATIDGTSWGAIDVTQAFNQNSAKHIAIERHNGYLRLYLDGVLVATGNNIGSSALAGTPSNDLQLLWRVDQAYDPNAWIDELRISNIARYQGSNFTPPTNPYTVD